MARIDSFLQLGREQGCSDIHFSVGLPPLVRLDGELAPLKYRELTEEETEGLLTEVLDPWSLEELETNGSTDFSYSAPHLGRFRLNVYRQRRGLAAICRIIADHVPRLSELGLPPVVSQLTSIGSGMILVTGGPGTGKTTTLAGLINEVNEHRNLDIHKEQNTGEFL